MAGRTDPLEALAALPRGTHAPCLTLLPVGFTEPSRSPGLLVSSYLAVSPLPHGPKSTRRFAFCCTFPGLSTGGCYPSLRPTEPGLSSRRVLSEPEWAIIRPTSAETNPIPRTANREGGWPQEIRTKCLVAPDSDEPEYRILVDDANMTPGRNYECGRGLCDCPPLPFRQALIQQVDANVDDN